MVAGGRQRPAGVQERARHAGRLHGLTGTLHRVDARGKVVLSVTG
jgi:hypothetical protein